MASWPTISKTSWVSIHPVGEKEPNAFGLSDMHGNVWKWVEDDYHADYQNAPVDGTAWVDTSKETSGAPRRRVGQFYLELPSGLPKQELPGHPQ